MSIKDWVNTQLKTITFTDVFVKDEKSQYTYREFFFIVSKVFDTLKKYGEYSKVIAVLENGIDLFLLYFLCLLNGKQILPIDPRKNVSEIEELIRQNRDEAFVIADSAWSECKNISVDIIRDVIGNETGYLEDTDVFKMFDRIDYRADYLITFTSGTTGNSKGVVHSPGNLFSTIKAFQDVNSIRTGTVFGHVMPMTYMAGILNSIIQPFILGARIVILGRFGIPLAIRFWKTLSQEAINVMWLSPTMLNMILQTDRGELGRSFCSEYMPQFFVGTAPLAVMLKQAFEDRYHVPLYVSYGLTEALYISVDTPDTSKLYDGNVGKMLDGVEIKKQEEEALIKTPWMFKRYTNEPTESYFSGQYYKTGDITREDDRILYIVGRKKDLIIKGGLNISPASIESEIMKTGLVEDVAVFGIENGVEEAICCVYACDKKDIQIEKSLNKVIREKLGITHTIDFFAHKDKLIYNLNGKIDKAAILAWIEEKNVNKN